MSGVLEAGLLAGPIVEQGQLAEQKRLVPLAALGGAIVGEAVGNRLLLSELVSRNMVNGDLIEAELVGGEEAAVADEEEAVTVINHERLANAEGPHRVRYTLNIMRAPRIRGVRLDATRSAPSATRIFAAPEVSRCAG